MVQKDILLEKRRQYSIYGAVLYVFSTTFIVYLSMGQPEDLVWNGLFWVLQLFICVNSVAKGFLQESHGRMLYFYSLCWPTDFILGKLLFNALLMLMMGIFSLGVFALLLGNPLSKTGMFLGISLLGGTGLGLVFTFLSAIAAKARQSAALMAILGFPIIVPQLLLLMKLSVPAFSDVVQEGWWQLLFSLIGLDVLVVALALILYPFLWKD